MQPFERALYKKGTNEGAIAHQPNIHKPFLAVTATQSNTYKTLKGAEKFMEKNGYEKIGLEKPEYRKDKSL